MRTENFDHGVESFGRGVCGTSSEVIEYRNSVIPECLDNGAEVVVAQSHYTFIPAVHFTHGFCRRDFKVEYTAKFPLKESLFNNASSG